MRNYEIMLVVKPDKVEEAASKMEQLQVFINERNGKVVEDSQWGVRDLAYEIDNYSKGDYRVWQFNLPPENLDELEKKLKNQDYLMRYLLVRNE